MDNQPLDNQAFNTTFPKMTVTRSTTPRFTMLKMTRSPSSSQSDLSIESFLFMLTVLKYGLRLCSPRTFNVCASIFVELDLKPILSTGTSTRTAATMWSYSLRPYSRHQIDTRWAYKIKSVRNNRGGHLPFCSRIAG